jgi:hypothetical protein
MSAYRYIVFPRGKQPADVEVRELQKFAPALAGQFAYGTCREDGRLVIAVDRAAFDHVREIDAGFEALVRGWTGRGCELVDHLAFVKNAAALKPAPTNTWHAHDGRGTVQSLRAAEMLAAKELAAREAIGRSLLGVERALERLAIVHRVAAVVPYLLIGLGAALTIGAGLFIRERMQNSGRERRQETIVRVVDDPLGEALEPATATPPSRDTNSAAGRR